MILIDSLFHLFFGEKACDDDIHVAIARCTVTENDLEIMTDPNVSTFFKTQNIAACEELFLMNLNQTCLYYIRNVEDIEFHVKFSPNPFYSIGWTIGASNALLYC